MPSWLTSRTTAGLSRVVTGGCWVLGLGSPVGEEEPLHQHHLRPGHQLPRPALLQLTHAVAGRGADVGRQGAVISLHVALVSNIILSNS